MINEKKWYYEVSGDHTKLPDFIDYFQSELDSSKLDLSLKGSLEKHNAQLPTILEKRFTQLQIVNAVLIYFETETKKEKSKFYKKYLENYNRQLTSRDIEKYIEGEPDIVALENIVNQIALIRNQYLGIIKAIENKSFSLSNITKLRTAGLDSAEIE